MFPCIVTVMVAFAQLAGVDASAEKAFNAVSGLVGTAA